MLDLENFLNNYNNIGFYPYIVVNGNEPIPVAIKEQDLQIIAIKDAERSDLLKGLNIQANDWKEYSGYFIHLPPNTKHSVQTCFLTAQDGLIQNVKNVIIAEANSELEIFTGCLSNSHVRTNTHNATTDIFVRENAKVTFNMVHSWGENSKVYPHTRVYVEKGGTYISNYVVWDKVKEIVSNPKVFLDDNAKSIMQTLAYVHPESKLDLGGATTLTGKNSSGEILSSVVSNGGVFTTQTVMEGNGNDSRGHIECNALLLNPEGKVTAIPQLQSNNDKTQLTHEASLGRISNEEIEYLQTKGISSNRAKSLIIQGFANRSIQNMPDSIKQKMESILNQAKDGF